MCMRGSARCMNLFGILTSESRYDVIVDQNKGFFLFLIFQALHELM